ncbi:hypothetical protein TR631_37945 [Streptomyces rochei]|uniref:hypothetical protein n=1 Tax=Streptomyces rochei TaxID=1928 RepID=UPI002ACE5516|nr:hypothetical protein [Streptomyces rochei]WQC10373.1 hypothetical protein TR631_00365 [Streptomyces rochei]WQC17302.1 hypothetical protein TR631_37945 [Streptomyces rochei]
MVALQGAEGSASFLAVPPVDASAPAYAADPLPIAEAIIHLPVVTESRNGYKLGLADDERSGPA